MLLREPYINIPVRHVSDRVRVHIKNMQGDVLRYFDVCISDDADSFDLLMPYDMSEFLGMDIFFEPDIPVIISNTPVDSAGLYHELNRSQFHFSSRWGWLNDPNGLVYMNGLYHLFYQHNPLGIEWGNMHWGHATSRDMLHWVEDGDVLYPDSMGTMFSGSAVVDYKNVSGLKDGDDAPVLLFYTASGEYAPVPKGMTQCLAYSTDGGKTFQKYTRNPIVPFVGIRNRDPKVVWNDDIGAWVMVLFVEAPDCFVLLRSDNLLEWEVFQENIIIDGGRECPDLFSMREDGGAERKWVLMTASGKYVVGDFIDERFVAETASMSSFGVGKGDEYAYGGQTWSNMPDGRCVFMAWQRGGCDEYRFNQSMTLPVEMKLKRDLRGQWYLAAMPIDEFKGMRVECYRRNLQNDKSRINTDIKRFLSGKSSWDIELDLIEGESGVINIYGMELVIDAENDEAVCNGLSLPMYNASELRVVVDRASVEIFLGDGRSWYAKRRLSSKCVNKLEVLDGNCFSDIRIFSVSSIWVN